MTIASFDLQVWPWPSTYPNKCFKWHLYSSRQGEQMCKIILQSMHKYRSYGPDNLWLFYHLTVKCDLDLQSTLPNVSNGTSTSQGEHLCQIILKSMHKCRSYSPDKLNLWPFYYLTFKSDHDLQPTQTNVSNGPTTPRGEHLCQINLKSMHKWTSYGPHKLNTCAKLFWNPCINVEVMA